MTIPPSSPFVGHKFTWDDERLLEFPSASEQAAHALKELQQMSDPQRESTYQLSCDMTDSLRYSIPRHTVNRWRTMQEDINRSAAQIQVQNIPREMWLMGMKVEVDHNVPDDRAYLAVSAYASIQARSDPRAGYPQLEEMLHRAALQLEMETGQRPTTLIVSPRMYSRIVEHLTDQEGRWRTPVPQIGPESEKFSDLMDVSLQELSKELTA